MMVDGVAKTIEEVLAEPSDRDRCQSRVEIYNSNFDWGKSAVWAAGDSSARTGPVILVHLPLSRRTVVELRLSLILVIFPRYGPSQRRGDGPSR
jgi:hypothetical protein